MARARTQIIGIHFSGGALAGMNTWIVRARRVKGVLQLVEAMRGVDLPKSGDERDVFLPALQNWLRKQRAADVGIDAAFGIPRAVLTRPSWPEFVEVFASKYDSPAALVEAGAKAEARASATRLTDRVHHRRSAPHRRRHGFQTHAWIARVLPGLLADHAVRAVPMQTPRQGVPLLRELAPSSFLRRVAIELPQKGFLPVSVNNRRALLPRLARWHRIEDAGDVMSNVIDDSEAGAAWGLVCVVLTSFAATGNCELPPEDWTPSEGWAYA